MDIGVTSWNLDNDKYYNATRNCLSSICYDCNNIVVIMHDTSDAVKEKMRKEFPAIEMINNPSWGNSLPCAYNYLLHRFFRASDHALLLGNDVVVLDGRFSWFDPDYYRTRGVVSAVDRDLKPEYIFASVIFFDWMFKLVGDFDIQLRASGLDHVYLARMASLGHDIWGKLDYYGDKKFIINHAKSLTINDLRDPAVFKPGQFFYDMYKDGEEYYNREMNKYKTK